ncbi:class I SAM-dependent rRNA methyltransferase [Paenibacillus sp.]|uniref:class I SAM-dependent rRNA methyltransferase n=1 Tax=Paenibacillus sp. TaxID=58172 RepID=UPI002D35A621|nr:class I SAM-dependent rRNA methyltransferase [Paenibacillus sp.]HZG84705.1 class I SAM-dependent rRNA methyltransferase [Paenibacillus sp.]
MATLVLKSSRKKRLEAGHPWIYKNEVERIDGEPEPGGIAEVTDHRGKFLASAYVNPASQMIGRVVSYGKLERMDKAFFVERFRACLGVRERFVEDPRYCRIVYGEADFLPGLTVDRFGDTLVLQIVTLGMDRVRGDIVEALVDVFAPKTIYERSDVGVRALEGLEERTGTLYGEEPPESLVIRENGLELEVDVVRGQKTGYFYDQRENRAAIRPLMTGWGRRSGIELREVAEPDGTTRVAPVNANGKEVTFPYWDGATVLECFSHTGSFTLHACKYGAKKVTCLDISEHAIETARRNVERNGFSERVEFVVANAFDYLREQVRALEERTARAKAGEAGAKVDTSKPLPAGAGRTWDVVILDPPAFAKTKGAVEGACRGYKDINLHGMKLVNEGGYLVTASCSYHVRPDVFLSTIHAAAADAGKVLRLVEFRGAGKDHPQLLGVDEGNYLKFAIFEVRSR